MLTWGRLVSHARSMNSLSIFAGIDSDGALRFVGDVPRGAACGCRCAACGAALVAKRGEEKVWHFAHEAAQERPECLAGAVNLLRRLAIEQLMERPTLTLPPFRQVVSTRSPLPLLKETVDLDVQPIATDRWSPNPVRGKAAARLTLADGSWAQLFVEVRSRQTAPLEVDQGVAAVLVEIPLPLEDNVLRDLAAAKAYLETSRLILWIQHPAGDALVLSATKRLDDRAQTLAHDRSVFAGWGRSEHAQRSAAEPGHQHDQSPIAVPEADNPQWVAWRKSKSSFIYYQGPDGNGWLLLQHRLGGQVLVPWPTAIEGWDEALPASVGIPDFDLGGYRVAHEVGAMVYLGRISSGVRNFSSSSDLPRR